MSQFRSLSISARLFGVSAALIAALAALAISSGLQLVTVRELANNVGSVKVQQLALIASTELKVAQVLSDIRQALLTNTPQDTEKAIKDIQAKRAQISSNDAAFLKEITAQAGRDAFDHDWLKLQAEVWPVAEANMKLLRDGKAEEAQAMLIKQTIPAYARMEAWLGSARMAQGKELGQEVEAIGQSADTIRCTWGA